MSLRILVVDDHAVVRRGVRSLLESHEGWKVCGEATTGRDIFQVTFTGSSPRRFGIPSGYEGTSMATPHVAGVAALLMSRGITSPANVEGIIKATAKDLGPPFGSYAAARSDNKVALRPGNRA